MMNEIEHMFVFLDILPEMSVILDTRILTFCKSGNGWVGVKVDFSVWKFDDPWPGYHKYKFVRLYVIQPGCNILTPSLLHPSSPMERKVGPLSLFTKYGRSN